MEQLTWAHGLGLLQLIVMPSPCQIVRYNSHICIIFRYCSLCYLCFFRVKVYARQDHVLTFWGSVLRTVVYTGCEYLSCLAHSSRQQCLGRLPYRVYDRLLRVLLHYISRPCTFTPLFCRFSSCPVLLHRYPLPSLPSFFLYS